MPPISIASMEATIPNKRKAVKTAASTSAKKAKGEKSKAPRRSLTPTALTNVQAMATATQTAADSSKALSKDLKRLAKMDRRKVKLAELMLKKKYGNDVLDGIESSSSDSA